MSQKIATVVGATGSQGSAVISALVQLGGYHIRGLTRNPSGEAAKALEGNGIEVLKADISDETSLKAAFAGSHVVYGVTDFAGCLFEHGAVKAGEIEGELGCNIARAVAATPTVEHFIFSTLPSAKGLTGGKLQVPHFDGKYQATEFIRSQTALLAKTTFLFVGFYGANFHLPPFTPRLMTTLAPLPSKYIAVGHFSGDTPLKMIGDLKSNLVPFIKAILEQPAKTKNGTIVLAATEDITFEGWLHKWAAIHGSEAVYVKTDRLTYYSIWPPIAEELGLMMELFDVTRDLAWSDQKGNVLVFQDLGLSAESFVALDESLKAYTF